jgi:hypothetical protein
MNTDISAPFWKVAAVLVVLHSVAISAANAQVQIKARAITTSSGERVCLISLSNESDNAKLESIKVKLFNYEAFIAEFGPFDLATRQTSAFEQSVGWNSHCTGQDVFYRVTYSKQGLVNNLIVTESVSAGTPSAVPGLLSQFVVALLALFSAGAGAWITHRFSLKREREKDHLAWKTKKFESAQPAIQNFLNSWAASIVPSMLESNFAELKRKVGLSSEIMLEYENTYKLLSDSRIGIDQKRDAAKKMDEAVRLLLNKADPYSSS